MFHTQGTIAKTQVGKTHVWETYSVIIQLTAVGRDIADITLFADIEVAEIFRDQLAEAIQFVKNQPTVLGEGLPEGPLPQADGDDGSAG